MLEPQDPELWADELIVYTHDSLTAQERLAGVRLNIGDLPSGTEALLDPDAVLDRACTYEAQHGCWPERLDVADLVRPQPIRRLT